VHEPDQPNQPVDLHSMPVDSLEAGLAAGFARPAHRPEDRLPTVSGYGVLREIARGGMGRILAAHDEGLGRDVALKVLLPGANADRFVRESKITAQLPHPGIPPVHALGRLADGSPFLVMKLVAGRTLAEELKAADRPRLLQAFVQVCQAVGFAHSRGVIHRDLKPANIMVGAFGEVHVMDWGLAKVLTDGQVAAEPPPASLPTSLPTDADAQTAAVDLSSSLIETDVDSPTRHDAPGQPTDDRTEPGLVLGTPAYMAPEQARGEPADARSDVFALGGILCTILTGQPPFRGEFSRDVLRRAAVADLADAHARLDA
jgi:eukaryotic-like serine/threonine-protein kinase